MQIVPIKTGVLQPPLDSLESLIKASALHLQEGDVLAISSKVVAIDEGRCVLSREADRAQLREQEATLSIPRDYWATPLTVTNNAFISSAGIDQSNGNGYYVLLPKDPFASAKRWHHWLCTQFTIEKLGIIIVDSHSGPFRYGATGISISWWGMEPLVSHIGTPDIFGRPLQAERSNLVDGLAAAANVVMGETNEQHPLAVVRNVPNVVFTDENTKNQLFSTFADDTFRVLYERWL